MRIAMAQMHMESSIAANLDRTLRAMTEAAGKGADLVFFPEIQLSPFFPKRGGEDASGWLVGLDGPEVKAIRNACAELGIWASPNVYLELDGKRYDASLMLDSQGGIRGISKMVNIYQAENFHERDYYEPSDDGFKVFDAPFGKIGVVICFDRHVPSSLRSCAEQGADIVIVPTANLSTEPLELFEWEMRVQAFQSTVFVAMCNRVGEEDGSIFAGESMVAAPDGSLLFKAGAEEGLFVVDIPVEKVGLERTKRDWLQF